MINNSSGVQIRGISGVSQRFDSFEGIHSGTGVQTQYSTFSTSAGTSKADNIPAAGIAAVGELTWLRNLTIEVGDGVPGVDALAGLRELRSVAWRIGWA
jgi:hypothetical protein